MTFIRRIAADDETIGGKARSLARLAALGLPAPAGFVVATSALRELLARGPAPPPELKTAADLAALDVARYAIEAGALPADLDRALSSAVAALCPEDASAARFAVRSSAPIEDGVEEAASGIFESLLRVPGREIANAVRTVLASALSPAAWAYALRAGSRPRGDIAVLVHEFVAGTTQGAVSCESRPDTGRPYVQLDVHAGSPTLGARATIEAAAVLAAEHHGNVELEWTATDDAVTFLQLRPYRPLARAGGAISVRVFHQMETEGWIWDAAHNPAPLSPAQTGLVELVDERCELGFRQRVVDGFLFFKRGAPPAGDASGAGPGSMSPRELLADLRAAVDATVEALGAASRLERALDLYVGAYGRLFGLIQQTGAAARVRLTVFLARHLPEEERAGWHRLLDDVPSAATRRRSGARALARAPDPESRQAAMDRYLAEFGDESPRWDVAEATLREAPQRLLLVGGAAAYASADDAPPPSACDDSIESRLRERVPVGAWAGVHEEYHEAVRAAREAVAAAEDDDALFARLQAVVRTALRALGRRLVAGGRLVDVEDVFFLPLGLARALDDEAVAANVMPAHLPDLATVDLVALVANGRAAFSAFAASPPVPPPPPGRARVIAGAAGAGGRIIGRVVLHPPVTPLGPGAVLVAATLLPTELPLLDPAAIVVETGSPLGHVAAQARERGIPAVVAAHGACAALHQGQTVVVDGDQGKIFLLTED